MEQSPTDIEALRARICEEVIAAVRAMEERTTKAPSGRRQVVLLFMSRSMPESDFFAQVATLGKQGFVFGAALSSSFASFNPAAALLANLPSGTRLISSAEADLAHAAKAADALIAPTISANTAAKVANGIEDSIPSVLMTDVLLSGKPVCIGRELATFGRSYSEAHPAIPPAMFGTIESNLHKLQHLGVRFVCPAGLAECVAGQFQEFKNETPERLARTRPSPKRVFVTAEDVWEATSGGKKELVHPRDAIVTDQAREYAVTRGIILRSE